MVNGPIQSVLHIPVLLEETIGYLVGIIGGTYVDATFGRGGHAKAILQSLSSQGRLIAFDRDREAVDYGEYSLGSESRFTIIHTAFSNMRMHLIQQHAWGKIAGILFDLGLSSAQIDCVERGFSFLKDGPLDMRMDTKQGISAALWIATVDEKTLANHLWQYGEERFARRIARAIVLERKRTKIETTLHLARLIKQASPYCPTNKHPATRTFQAIRIVINQELRELELGLKQAIEGLALGGRLAVISFHSLEDRIVKQWMLQHASPHLGVSRLPIKQAQFRAQLKLVTKPIKPNRQEVQNNSRARSAILRIAEKIS